MAVITEHEHVDSHGDGSNLLGTILGFVLVIVLLALFFYYGLPVLRGAFAPQPAVQVPSQVDVNVDKQ